MAKYMVSKLCEFLIRGILTITGIVVMFCTMYNMFK